MSASEQKKLRDQISRVKKDLAALGEMRPGALGEQYNVCGNPNCRCKDKKNPQKHGPYFQLSYTWKGRSKTEFVKPDDVIAVKEQLANYKLFKALTAKWVDLSLQLAKVIKAQKAADAKKKVKI